MEHVVYHVEIQLKAIGWNKEKKDEAHYQEKLSNGELY